MSSVKVLSNQLEGRDLINTPTKTRPQLLSETVSFPKKFSLRRQTLRKCFAISSAGLGVIWLCKYRYLDDWAGKNIRNRKNMSGLLQRCHFAFSSKGPTLSQRRYHNKSFFWLHIQGQSELSKGFPAMY